MAPKEHAVSVDQIPLRQRGGSLLLVGNPNSGKSTLFNRLTGLRQKTANYPGVTVERREGSFDHNGRFVNLVDLPGLFTLGARGAEERVAVEVILGRLAGVPDPDGVVAVVDATRLYQGLYLVQQLLELQLPVVVVLTMMDAAEREGIHVDTDSLSRTLGGVPIVGVVGTTGQGFEDLKNVIDGIREVPIPAVDPVWPDLTDAARGLVGRHEGDLSVPEVQRLLVDDQTPLGVDLLNTAPPDFRKDLAAERERLLAGEPGPAVEARRRYQWILERLPSFERRAPVVRRWFAQWKEWINQPVPATIGFFLLMAVVFQAVFSWATPVMDLIDAGTVGLGAWVAKFLPDGLLASLIVDGLIAGVGSVIIFLPQILILFLFIILLEDSGYLARAAFLMDRAMRSVGLSGQSVIPMLSSFACAVPAIMATRVIPNRRDRIATILAAPFMTCSARLPVYALLIAAFVPATKVGWLNLQGLVLFGLYMLGILGGLFTAWLLRRSALRGPKPPFALAMPEFRVPNWRTVSIQLLDRGKIFLRRAGTVIFAVAVVVWALAYFPRTPSPEIIDSPPTSTALVAGAHSEDDRAAAQLENSWLGRAGRVVEPVFRPLGWDWRVSAAVIAGFPAREVVVAVLGTIYAVGSEPDETRLAGRLQEATWPDGRTVFTLPMVIGLLIFYAWCLQCAATVAVIRRETNTWRWPIFSWAYMTGVGYLGALLSYQIGTALM